MRKRIQPPQPDLFRDGPNVAVMDLGVKGREHGYTYGLDCLLQEAACNVSRVLIKVCDFIRAKL